MKTPRFTDTHKYPHGYRPAARTNIRATFLRVRAAMKENATEVAAKVEPIRKASR